jgi:hypothetical protein
MGSPSASGDGIMGPKTQARSATGSSDKSSEKKQ